MDFAGQNIDPALVKRLVATQFPEWADLSIRPVERGGGDNRTFRLGEDKLVRLPSACAYAPAVAKEQRWLPVLAASLSLSIPRPLATGAPAYGYPWLWSVYRWLEGQSATVDNVEDLPAFATRLALFVAALQHIDPADGPLPGPHNFFRGGSLDVYDAETRAAFEALRGNIDVVRARAVWEAACAPWDGPPVWIHGDLDAANLLVVGGRLSAVIDFGCCGIGDCACDLTIAWTFFEGESRRAFREALPVEPSTWVRARGWALWKAAITLARRSAPKREVERARYVLGEVLAEHDGAG